MIKNRYILTRTYKNMDKKQFKIDIETDVELIDAITCMDTNLATCHLQTVIMRQLNKWAPLKKMQLKTNYAPYISESTKDAMKNRDKLHKDARKNNNPERWILYRQHRNEIVKTIKDEKKKYEMDKLSTCTNDPKAQWNMAKTIMKWNKIKAPNKLIINNKITTDNNKIKQAMNEYYKYKPVKVRGEIPDGKSDPLLNYKKIHSNNSYKPTFKLETILMSQLRNHMKSMKATNSTGVDGISMKTLKMLQDTIEPVLLNIINTSIVTNTFPNSLKIAKILPNHKTGKNDLLPEAYRPINILNTISKIIEKVVASQLKEFLKINKLIPFQHNGGIQGKLTVTTALTLLDMWSKILEENNEAVCIHLDQTAAFEIVDHEILVAKLKILGTDKNTADWFKSYLLDRRQTTLINGSLSTEVTMGPYSTIQGSIIACLLYLIYTLDFPLLFHKQKHDPSEETHCKGTSALTFVDDINATIKAKVNITLQESMISNLELCKEFMNSNKLALNKPKTKVFAITNNINTADALNINEENQIVKNKKP